MKMQSFYGICEEWIIPDYVNWTGLDCYSLLNDPVNITLATTTHHPRLKLLWKLTVASKYDELSMLSDSCKLEKWLKIKIKMSKYKKYIHLPE